MTAVVGPETARGLSFKAWLARFGDDRSPLGDLARDVSHDDEWPRGPGALDRYYDYLSSVGACEGALDALADAWSQFEREARSLREQSTSPGENLTAAELVIEGRCSAPCLVASNDEAAKCACRCGGAFHGRLAEVEVAGAVRIEPWYRRYCYYSQEVLDSVAPVRSENAVWKAARRENRPAIWVSKEQGWGVELDQITMKPRPWRAGGNPLRHFRHADEELGEELVVALLEARRARSGGVGEYCSCWGLGSREEAQVVGVIWHELLMGNQDGAQSCIRALREDAVAARPVDPG